MCIVCSSLMPHRDHSEIAVSAGADVTSIPLSAIVPESGDAAANGSTTAQIAVGDTFSGTIATPSDIDWIKVDLSAGQQYTVAVAGTGALGSSNDDPNLVVRDQFGGVVSLDNDSGPGSYATTTFTATYSGTYFIPIYYFISTWNHPIVYHYTT